MKDNSLIHPLARPNEKSGKITFVDIEGEKHTFYACVNDLTGSGMCWFDNDPPNVDESQKYIKSVFKGIREGAAAVIEVVGDY